MTAKHILFKDIFQSQGQPQACGILLVTNKSSTCGGTESKTDPPILTLVSGSSIVLTIQDAEYKDNLICDGLST